MFKLVINEKQPSITQRLTTDDDIKKVISAILTMYYILSGMAYPVLC